MDEDEGTTTHVMKVVVPSSFTHPTMKIPVRHPRKRLIVVHFICNDVTFPKPFLIIQRKTIDGLLLKKLVCRNLIIKFQTKGFTNTEIMIFWISNIFFLFVEEKWNIENQRSVNIYWKSCFNFRWDVSSCCCIKFF